MGVHFIGYGPLKRADIRRYGKLNVTRKLFEELFEELLKQVLYSRLACSFLGWSRPLRPTSIHAIHFLYIHKYFFSLQSYLLFYQVHSFTIADVLGHNEKQHAASRAPPLGQLCGCYINTTSAL